MTTIQLEAVPTVHGLLFDGDSAADAIARSIHEHGTVASWTEGIHRLTGAGGQAIEHEAARAVDGFLSLDVIDLAAGGWRDCAALREAARVTRADPERTEIVPMLTHRITSRHHPTIDVLVDGEKIGTLQVDVTVVLDIEGMLAVVEQAQLVGAQGARCSVTGTLTIEDYTAAQRSRSLDLPGTLRLRSGIQLLPPDIR